MAEITFAGISFKGGKVVGILVALSTLGGGLWAGFEFYKDYLDMKEKIKVALIYKDEYIFINKN